MNLINKVTSFLPGKSQEQVEYFFALDIGSERLKICLWIVSGDKLKILNIASEKYSSNDEIVEVTDKLLDQALGDLQFEPEKLLFGVPESWLVDDNLKEPYLALLRNIVKSLELKPMAYVSSSHAICHFLEKNDGAPPTAILAGIGENNVSVTIVRGGKIDGTRVSKRSDNLGEDIEKILLSFSEVEVLPARMLLFDLAEGDLDKHKNSLSSYPWMNRLSFLHLPKIGILEKDIEIKSVALAGGVELNPEIKYQSSEVTTPKHSALTPLPQEQKEIKHVEERSEDLGFVTGDITDEPTVNSPLRREASQQSTVSVADENLEDLDSEEKDVPVATSATLQQREESKIQEWEGTISKRLPFLKFLIPILIIFAVVAGYIFLPQAKVTIFIEPRILEKDTQVTADPKAKSVDEAKKVIPGQITETQVSGSDKISATGTKKVGESAKGTVVITNKTNSPKSFSKGTIFSGPDDLKFTLDSAVTVASQSATEDGISFGKVNGDVTADEIGADSNIQSGTQLTLSGVSSSDFSAKAEGNFSGGTSKDVTVVSDSDQKKLLASLAEKLKTEAQEKLQSKLPGKKILEEALSEEIVKKSFNKDINDQAGEFSLNLTINFKGTAYSDEDLKSIVSKLVETNVPEGFELKLSDTETQADVSRVDKDGKLIFLARFRAKLMPKLDEGEIRRKIKGKTPQEVADILKSYENVLGSEIKITPSLPAKIARLPLLDRNIKIEVSLK